MRGSTKGVQRLEMGNAKHWGKALSEANQSSSEHHF